MLIYGAMIIPLVTAVVLLLFFQHRTKWWEIGIPLVISLALCAGFKMLAEHSATRDTEYWGSWVTSSHYYEPWNEYIHKTCSTTTCSGGKNSTCTTSYYDCSYVQSHSARWTVQDSGKVAHRINQTSYKHFVKLFGMSPQFVDMHRSYHSKDGDQYRIFWPETKDTLEPLVTLHTYENRVQAAKTVFSFVDVSDEQAQAQGLFAYPKISLFNTPSVLGNCGASADQANKGLRYHNAVLGREKQLRMWLLCFQGGDLARGHLQEAYWTGGNKNEVVVTVGLSEAGDVLWNHPFSWADDQTPIIEIRDFIAAQGKFDPVSAVEFMAPTLQKSFVRKHFADFSYLTVEPPTWAIIMTWVITLLVNIGLSFWVVHNEFAEDSRSYY